MGNAQFQGNGINERSAGGHSAFPGVLEILKHSTRQFSALLLLLVGGITNVHSQSGVSREDSPIVSAPSYMVVEAVTGTVLLEKTPDMVYPTASLAKLMTLHLSLEDVAAGKLESTRTYPVPAQGTARRTGSGSSVLGLADGDRVSLITLQRAAAVASANDAARAIAVISAGSLESFVDRMNLTARKLGMNRTRYADPDGWSGGSRTTVADQMKLARSYLLFHPQAPSEIHEKTVLEYQKDDFLSSYPKKGNTNLLLGQVPGVDGLKTGTIPLSTFHFLATAQRNGVRFIALVMGIEADSYSEGLKARAADAEKLLEWSFKNYTLKVFDSDFSVGVRVRHGEKDHLVLRPEYIPPPVVVERGNDAGTVLLIYKPEFLLAPVKAGTTAGTAHWFVDGRPVRKVPLVVDEDVGYRWKIRDLILISPRSMP